MLGRACATCYCKTVRALGALVIKGIPLAKRQLLGMIKKALFWQRLLIIELEITPEESECVVYGAMETFLAAYDAAIK